MPNWFELWLDSSTAPWFELTLDTTAPQVTFGQVPLVTRGELLQVSYTITEPAVVQAQLVLPDQVVPGTFNASRLEFTVPLTATDPARIEVIARDDLLNEEIFTLPIVIGVTPTPSPTPVKPPSDYGHGALDVERMLEERETIEIRVPGVVSANKQLELRVPGRVTAVPLKPVAVIVTGTVRGRKELTYHLMGEAPADAVQQLYREDDELLMLV